MQTRILSFPRPFSVIAIVAIAALTVAGSTTAFAAGRAETTTYVDGNLTGVSPNTGGTLLFSDDKAMYFRTGLSTVAVPYAGISHAELGATKETSHDVPLYKVWALHKRAGKTETQLLIVNFKNDAGEDKSMTLELAQASAPGVLSLIQSRAVTDAAPAKTLIASAEPERTSAEPAKTLLVSGEPGSGEPQQTSAEPAKIDTNQTAAPQVQSPSQSEPQPRSKKEARAAAKRDAEKAAAAKADKPAGWWGDDYWKTARNSDKWNARTPLSTANDQR